MPQFRLFIEIGPEGATKWFEIAEALRNVANTIINDHAVNDPIVVGNYQNVMAPDGYNIGTYGVKDDKLKVV
jgi:hypothetical protein